MKQYEVVAELHS